MDIQKAHQEQIQPALLARLAEDARRSGKSINELLAELLHEWERTNQPPAKALASPITPEEWSRELRSWAASHFASPVIADDSRESIYEGRGE